MNELEKAAAAILESNTKAPEPTSVTTPQGAAPAAPAPEAPKAPETPEAPKAPEPEKKDEFAPKFAALSRKEKALAERERAFEEKQKAYSGLSLEALKEKAKKEGRLAVLAELGITYEDVTNEILESGKTATPTDKLSSEVEELKKQLKARADKEEEDAKMAAQARQQQAVADYKGKIESHIKSNAERFELVNGTLDQNSVELVYQVIDAYYTKTYDESTKSGRILSFDEACEEVEKRLETQIDRWSKFSKVQKRFSPGNPPSKNEAPPAPKKEAKESVTITNADAAGSSEVRTSKPSNQDLINEAKKHLRFA